MLLKLMSLKHFVLDKCEEQHLPRFRHWMPIAPNLWLDARLKNECQQTRHLG